MAAIVNKRVREVTLTDRVMEALLASTDNAGYQLVVSRPRGGLGNQLFQLAAAMFVAERSKANLAVSLDAYSQRRLDKRYRGQPLRNFDLERLFGISSMFELCDKIGLISSNSVRLLRAQKRNAAISLAKLSRHTLAVEFKGQYHTLNNSQNTLILDGYWQSSAVPKAVQQNMLDLYSHINPLLKAEAAEGLQKLGGGPFVAVHVRRGDYVSGLFDTMPIQKEYYDKAITHFFDFQPLIFSDDIDWCKNNLNIKDAIYWENCDPLVTFVAMSLCNANLIANSTYSWWAAWFNTGSKVVGPADWFRSTSPYGWANQFILDPLWISVK